MCFIFLFGAVCAQAQLCLIYWLCWTHLLVCDDLFCRFNAALLKPHLASTGQLSMWNTSKVICKTVWFTTVTPHDENASESSISRRAKGKINEKDDHAFLKVINVRRWACYFSSAAGYTNFEAEKKILLHFLLRCLFFFFWMFMRTLVWEVGKKKTPHIFKAKSTQKWQLRILCHLPFLQFYDWIFFVQNRHISINRILFVYFFSQLGFQLLHQNLQWLDEDREKIVRLQPQDLW